MKTGIYIYRGSKNEFYGVNKKIKSQIKLFAKCFEMHEVVIEKQETNAMKSVLWRLPGGSWGACYDEALSEIKDISSHSEQIAFFYIRQNFADLRYIRFISELKIKYPDATIIMEVPSWPYKGEVIRNKTMWPWFFKDALYNRFYRKYIDKVVTFTKDKSLFGISALYAMNGIDVDDVDTAICKESPCIQLVAIAMMQPYHGFERLLKGMFEYYEVDGTRDVRLKLVGDGGELSYYKQLVKELKLQDRVEFTGALSGRELSESYNYCDLAVGSLGGYKINVDYFSSIKLGEYLAKGLPVITSGRIAVFENYGDEFSLGFPNNSTSIDITKIINYYDKLYDGGTIDKKEKVRAQIHEFALNSIDIHVAMGEVISYLEKLA